MQLGSSQPRGKQKPADAKTQQLAEQAYKELLDHIEDVPRNYVLDDSKYVHSLYILYKLHQTCQFSQPDLFSSSICIASQAHAMTSVTYEHCHLLSGANHLATLNWLPLVFLTD